MATNEHFDYDFDLIPGSMVRRFYFFEPAEVFQMEEGGSEQYYNYVKVYEKAKELFSGDEETLAKVEKSYKYFEEKNKRRNRRALVLKGALERHGLALRKDSWISKQYIFYRTFPVRDVVFTMHKMDVLHKKCSIRDKWNVEKDGFIQERRRGANERERKVHQPNRGWKSQRAQVKNSVSLRERVRPEMSLWAIKDLFYDREYMEYVKEHPESKFMWVAPSYEELAKNGFDYNKDEEENGVAESAFDDDEGDIKTI